MASLEALATRARTPSEREVRAIAKNLLEIVAQRIQQGDVECGRMMALAVTRARDEVARSKVGSVRAEPL